jgi:hypothetical protein
MRSRSRWLHSCCNSSSPLVVVLFGFAASFTLILTRGAVPGHNETQPDEVMRAQGLQPRLLASPVHNLRVMCSRLLDATMPENNGPSKTAWSSSSSLTGGG